MGGIYTRYIIYPWSRDLFPCSHFNMGIIPPRFLVFKCCPSGETPCVRERADITVSVSGSILVYWCLLAGVVMNVLTVPQNILQTA